VLRSVARRRLVKAGNPSACAEVNWKLCKSAIALYCLYLSVIKRECVTEVLINPIIRTRTRHFRHAYHPTRDNIYIKRKRERGRYDLLNGAAEISEQIAPNDKTFTNYVKETVVYRTGFFQQSSTWRFVLHYHLRHFVFLHAC
jgi:hypothetical protein